MFELQIRGSGKENKVPGGSSLNLLKKVVDCLLDFVEEAEFKLDESGINIQIMDSMHVALADIHLANTLFDSYRCDRNLVLGINLKSFSGILKDIQLEKECTLELHCQDDASCLVMVYESKTHNLSFKIKLFSYDLETYNFPELEYTVEATMRTEKFMLVSRVIGSFADFLAIDAEKDKITFTQKGDAAESFMVLKSSFHEDIDIKVSNPVRKEIAMKYIKYISKVGMLTQTVRICMGKQSPIFFDFSLGEFGHMKFYIAPKIMD